MPLIRRFQPVLHRYGPFSLLSLLVRRKGDYGFNMFHNSNPQHGGSYARHERRMREEEVEDFLRSVKGWTPVNESVAVRDVFDDVFQPPSPPPQSSGSNTTTTNSANDNNKSGNNQASASGDDYVPPVFLGDEAIKRSFTFDNFDEAYLFMGRLWAFAYGSDKYPHVLWDTCTITVYLYSPSFRGLSKREARIAAFLNDQFNMLRKSKIQREKIVNNVAMPSTVEKCVGDAVRRSLEAKRPLPLYEATERPVEWENMLKGTTHRET